MYRRFFTVVAVLALTGTILGSGSPKPRWIKLKQAKAYAAQTGMPICVYATANVDGGGC